MHAWFRALRRKSMPLADAWREAEEDLAELSDRFDEQAESMEESEDVNTVIELQEQIEALTAEAKNRDDEIYRLRKDNEQFRSPEGACALFLDSSVGRVITQKLGALQEMQVALEALLSETGAPPPSPRTPEETVTAFRRLLQKKKARTKRSPLGFSINSDV